MIVPQPFTNPFGPAPFGGSPFGVSQPVQPVQHVVQEQPKELSLPRVVNYLADYSG